MRVFFLITARGGSKGVPGKNIREIAGMPLIAYKIVAAQKCGYKGRIIVSTDDEKIASISRKYNAEVPFMRPALLATDTASSMDVVQHAIEWLDVNDTTQYDYICLLEPSSPFASPTDLGEAIKTIVESDADTLLGMKEVEVTRNLIWGLDDNGGLSYFYKAVSENAFYRRQDQPVEYTMNGCMYIAKMEYFRKHRTFHSCNSVPYIMPTEKSIEIDDERQYDYARYCVERGYIDITEWR